MDYLKTIFIVFIANDELYYLARLDSRRYGSRGVAAFYVGNKLKVLARRVMRIIHDVEWTFASGWGRRKTRRSQYFWTLLTEFYCVHLGAHSAKREICIWIHIWFMPRFSLFDCFHRFQCFRNEDAEIPLLILLNMNFTVRLCIINAVVEIEENVFLHRHSKTFYLHPPCWQYSLTSSVSLTAARTAYLRHFWCTCYGINWLQLFDLRLAGPLGDVA